MMNFDKEFGAENDEVNDFGEIDVTLLSSGSMCTKEIIIPIAAVCVLE